MRPNFGFVFGADHEDFWWFQPVSFSPKMHFSVSFFCVFGPERVIFGRKLAIKRP